MKTKTQRLQLIRQLLTENTVTSQEELMDLMKKNGSPLTQSTLSRDMKELNVSKTVLLGGGYRYVLPRLSPTPVKSDEKGFVSIAFSGNIAVVKTRAGYASRLAYEIDENASDVVIGTVAGEDTVILVLNEKSTREQVIAALSTFIKIQ